MPRLAVVYTRRAAGEVERIDAYWRENRPESPDLFLADLLRTLALVAIAPRIGIAARDERIAGVRRVLLQRTGHHLYYRIHDDMIQVLAVWHGARGVGPEL
jgi:plasmid stabilization system protein ParE